MAKKPTAVFPTWATSVTGLANTVYPGATKQGDGWVDDEEPPSSWFNWYKNAVGQWGAYATDAAVDAQQGLLVENTRPRVINGLASAFSSPNITVQYGTAAVFNSNTPASAEPHYWIISLHNPLTYTLPGGVLSLTNTWVSIFVQRNATSGGLEVTHTVGTATAFGAVASGQVQIAVWRNGALYDARSIASQGTHNMRGEDADYLSNQVVVSDNGDDIIINSRVLSKSASQQSASEYVCNTTFTAAEQAIAGEGAVNTFAANQVYYLYLYKPGTSGRDAGLIPNSNCIPFLSVTPPGTGLRARSSSGTPFLNVLMSGQAVLIGAVKRTSGNTGWRNWVTFGDTIHLQSEIMTVANSIVTSFTSSITLSLDVSALPVGRYYGSEFDCRIVPDTAPDGATLTVNPTGGNISYRAAFACFYDGTFQNASPISPIHWMATPAYTLATATTLQASHETRYRVVRIKF